MKLVKFIIIVLVLFTQANAQSPSSDCNNNSIDDAIDISSGNEEDCNFNLIPDSCEIAEHNGKNIEVAPGVFKTANLDQNNNGKLDICDDCNFNQLPDLCDIDSNNFIWISSSDLLSDPFELTCAQYCPSEEYEEEGEFCGTENDCQTSSDISGYLTPDSCENDFDDDGVIDNCEECPQDPDKLVPGICGCGVSEVDSDEDGTPECIDTCPDDPNKIAPGVCGCGIADTDSDDDGEPDCKDQCPDDPRFVELPCSYDCSEKNQLAQIFELDGASYELSRTVASAAKILRNVTDNPNNGINKEFRAQGYYLLNWDLSWSLPILSLSCATNNACVVVSNVSILNSYDFNAAKLRRLVFNMVASIIANTTRPTPIRRARKLRRRAKKLYRLAIATSATIDKESELCP